MTKPIITEKQMYWTWGGLFAVAVIVYILRKNITITKIEE